MHFGQILVTIFSQTRKLENSMSFDPISLNLKSLNSKNFYNFETRNTQTQTPKRQLNSNLKKSKLHQALLCINVSKKYIILKKEIEGHTTEWWHTNTIIAFGLSAKIHIQYCLQSSLQMYLGAQHVCIYVFVRVSRHM